MRPKSPNGPAMPGSDRLIAELASRQHGVVARRQLLDLGLRPTAIRRRLRLGRLHRLHAGVYLVGHRAIRRGTREMAAVLACGPAAVVSHRSAAALWHLLPYPAKSTPVSVTVAGGDRRPRSGIDVHRVTQLDKRDRRTLHGIPLTSPARTIVDLGATLRTRELERVVAESLRGRLVAEQDLDEALERNRGRAGIAALRRLLGREGGPKFTRSGAEDRMLSLVRNAGLPEPEVNVCLDGWEPDFLWREQRAIVEVDSWRYHSDRFAFQSDRDKSNDLQLDGYRVLRITWYDLVNRPALVVSRIRRALSQTIWG